jgi:hypothetical protein
MDDASAQPGAQRVEAPAAKDAAVRMFIVAFMLVGMGAWCLTDMRKPPEAWDAKHANQAGAYLLNNWGPVVFLPAGGLFGAWAVSMLRRVMVADAAGIGYAGKPQTPWADIARLDASRFEDKGMLDLYDKAGKRIRLDSWKLTNFKALVAFVEQHVPESARE